MPSAVADRQKGERAGAGRARIVRGALALFERAPLVRELLVVLVFCLFTTLLTWPYVTRMRDAVVDPGDPYLVSWIMWWDYHQTFRDPLNLFHSNTFYPLRYTLAFSEHCYGLALPFFPLFALGLRPLTVHAVAMFLGFALSGYGAFRLARTLTNSTGAAWVAGIVFAFVPFRFHLMSQLVYLFSPWLPLVFEALVLFVRARTWKRAVWLGFAFFMTGLTSVSFFAFALVPLAAAAALLATRHGLWREREFWRRGAVAVGLASLGLVPFMLPYYLVSKLYGFKRSIEEVKANSAWPMHWLSVENRNKLWFGMGEAMPEGARFKLFPGLLPILFSIAALFVGPSKRGARVDAASASVVRSGDSQRRRLLARLDALIVFALAVSILAVGFDNTDYFGGLFRHVTSERALTLLAVGCAWRLCVAYPAFLRTTSANLVATIKDERRGDTFWLGLILFAVGFFYSLGWNFFFYRICYDLLPVFRSMRVPTRGAMFAYLGISLLAGLGVGRLAELISVRKPRVRPVAVYVAACVLLLVELNGAPLSFMRGEVYPDAVTLRLKQTAMRGGIVVLPASPDFNHRYMLRSADHARPLIVGTSGFVSPQEDEIEHWTGGGSIPSGLLNLLERIPASYVVVKNELIGPERRQDYATFFARAVAAGRLRFVNRFDGRDDLYAVVKTEPEARSEASPPPELELRDWVTLVTEDTVNLLGQYTPWCQSLYRLRLVESGTLPRYADFMSDVTEVGRGLVPGSEESQGDFDARLRNLSHDLSLSPEFQKLYEGLDDAHYVTRLYENAGLAPDPSERDALAGALASKAETRAGALLKVSEDTRLVERERNRSLLLLHYFGFLRRNPDDPPDHDLEGFNFWLAQLERTSDPEKIALAFRDSIEYKKMKKE
ncbi:MAG: hypothetical protein QOE46_2163 [Acidobacteriota bacterium]|jgi:hypothetical protein|nr:hypothetical protein [Acidobacteriota bacterium]